MKLLLDQNLSFRLLEKLEAAYLGSTQVHLIGMDQADDLAIWSYAKEQGFVIVTKDPDFHELGLVFRNPPKVIWLNLESSVGRGEVCVCGGAGQGTTTRNSDSIPRNCNAAMCRRKRAIHPVA